MTGKVAKRRRKTKGELAQDLATCGKWLVFACKTCNRELSVVLAGCGHRVCARCAREFADGLCARIAARTREILGRKRPGWSLKLVTLTLRKSGDLRADVLAVQRGTSRIWKTLLKVDGGGAIACVEVGPNGGAHVHMLYYGPYISQRRLSAVWSNITGSSVVHIRAVYGDPMRAAREVTKYCSKLQSMHIDDAHRLYDALYGCRRVLEYGVFLGTAAKLDHETVCPWCYDDELVVSRIIYDDDEALAVRKAIRAARAALGRGG